MRNSVLQYPFINSDTYSTSLCDYSGDIRNNPAFNWMLYGKIPEAVTIKPKYTTVVASVSGKNRYLSGVTVEPMKPSLISIGTTRRFPSTFKFDEAASATSSNPGVVSTSIADGILTLNSIGEGSSTITVYDAGENIISIIEVSVDEL